MLFISFLPVPFVELPVSSDIKQVASLEEYCVISQEHIALIYISWMVGCSYFPSFILLFFSLRRISDSSSRNLRSRVGKNSTMLGILIRKYIYGKKDFSGKNKNIIIPTDIYTTT